RPRVLENYLDEQLRAVRGTEADERRRVSGITAMAVGTLRGARLAGDAVTRDPRQRRGALVARDGLEHVPQLPGGRCGDHPPPVRRCCPVQMTVGVDRSR